MFKIRYSLILLIPVSLFAQNTFPTSGNVGIGTTNPSGALEINQTVSDRAFLIKQPNNSQQIIMHLANNSAGQYGYLNLGGNTLLRGNGIRSSFGGPLGIGTPNPSSMLTVNGNFEFSPKSGSYINLGMDQLSSFITGKTGAYIYSGDGPRGIIPAGTLVLQSRSNVDRDIVFVSGATPADRMRIKGNGDVVINTQLTVGSADTNIGAHKLAVEGSIGAREVKVQANGWSDFVFEKDYDLPTLEEVANHIEQKGHLKDIPSAAEVEKEGIFLGEMDSKLLQKIEELTLYTIEQEEKIDAQNQVIQKISKKLEILEHMLKTYSN
ncbi:hypothetical protein DSM03_11620 [Leeuwenhoekiella aestuarii]|uniref:hypothetical protein n=1 Tax=Leeuwenhoekiella aestuarii TaxID=2249426 RepID=UPI000FFF20CF|nr:hypothetical protein [Leeuwenhoekiella aestuarii]RXG11489.1 hypothetical protein DSM03_11620 [Leeuwenhoekiella aestuarii]